MTSQEAFEKAYNNDTIEVCGNSRKEIAWSAWQASRAALLEEIKAGGWIPYGGDKHYRLPDEGEVK
jgi:hypothetical protein